MRASELIRELQVEVDALGDKEVVAGQLWWNRAEGNMVLALPIIGVGVREDVIVLETE